MGPWVMINAGWYKICVGDNETAQNEEEVNEQTRVAYERQVNKAPSHIEMQKAHKEGCHSTPAIKRGKTLSLSGAILHFGLVEVGFCGAIDAVGKQTYSVASISATRIKSVDRRANSISYRDGSHPFSARRSAPKRTP